MRYTLQDYSDILFTGYNYQLPENTQNIINNLTKELGVVIAAAAAAANSSNKPDEEYKRSNMHYSNKRSRPESRFNKGPTDTQWKTVPQFKVTKMEKKEGTAQLMNEVRVCLNKISNKNYEQQRDAIIKWIEEIEEGDDPIKSIAQSIFDIASSNKFYSELYALLYKELIDKFDLFSDYITNLIENYHNSIGEIEFVDSNLDYDKYCENNKLNDKRKAMSTFIINLMKKGVLKKNDVLQLIIDLQERVILLIDTDDSVNLVDEITENLYILITLVAQDTDTHIDENPEQIPKIKSNVEMCSKYKVKEHKSISSRAIFKYMDIVKCLNN
jgi:hypothetical protein